MVCLVQKNLRVKSWFIHGETRLMIDAKFRPVIIPFRSRFISNLGDNMTLFPSNSIFFSLNGLFLASVVIGAPLNSIFPMFSK